MDGIIPLVPDGLTFRLCQGPVVSWMGSGGSSPAFRFIPTYCLDHQASSRLSWNKHWLIVDFVSLCRQVKALKEKIEAERGKDNFPVSGQKLIYAGKILQDDTPIKEYKIDERNFVVVMVSKVSADRRRYTLGNLTPLLVFRVF